jgi:hypothetical protein
MKRKTFILLIFITTGAILLAARNFPVEEKEEVRKTLNFQDPSKSKELVVDNVFGSIDVRGYDGQSVELLVQKTIRAKNQEKIQRAKEEVHLEITTEENTIDLYVDGPFRCSNNRKRWRSWKDPGYEVHYDFTLKVPRLTSLYLKTVNKGKITVQNVKGEFAVRNVNGEIEMVRVAGSGEAHTVNGKVKVLFTQNPRSDCSFRTINGNIEVIFLEDLSADFRLKTFNGDAYSDFPFSYTPARAAVQGRKKGKYVYKSDRFTGVRIGKGGPEIKMDTLNGDILIAKKK